MPYQELSHGKLPAQDIDMEIGVLGWMLMNGAKADQVLEIVTPECFYKETNKDVFVAVQELRLQGEEPDILLVIDQLRKNEKLEDVGGPHWISQLTNKAPGRDEIIRHCLLLQEFRMKREIAAFAYKTYQSCTDMSTDVFEIGDSVERELAEIMDVPGKGNKTIKQLTIEADQDRKKGEEHKGMTGITTGLPTLNLIYGGRQFGDLILTAGRPGMGKTGYAATNLRAVAKAGIPCAAFSMEMTDVKFVQRLIAQGSKVSLTKVMRGGMTPEELSQYNTYLGQLENLPIHVDGDTVNLSGVITRIRNYVRKHKVKYVLIDHLGWIKIPGTKKNKNDQLDEITKTLKRVAKQEDIVIHLLAQLNRAVESRGGTFRPRLSDLRDSGTIEENCDVIEFLFRPEYYNLTEYENGESTFGIAEIDIAKHRNGRTTTEKFRYLAETTGFTEINDVEYEGPDSNQALKPSMDFDDQPRKPYVDNDDDGFDIEIDENMMQ